MYLHSIVPIIYHTSIHLLAVVSSISYAISGLELYIVHLFCCTPLRGGGDREGDGDVGRGEKCLGEEWISTMDDVISHMVNYPIYEK